MRHRITPLVATGLLVVLLLGCQQQAAPATKAPAPQPVATQAAAPQQAPAPAPAATQAPQAAPAAQATGTVKLGIVVSLSGASARLGSNNERFIRLAIDDVNAAGGFKVGDKVYKFEAATVDDKSTTEGGRDAADRLILAEKSKFLTGSVGSPTAGGQTVSERNKVLYIAYSASDKSVGPDFPLTFVSASHTTMRISALYEWVKKTYPKVKNVAIVYSDDSAGRATSLVSERIAKAAGYNVTAMEYYPMDVKDLTPMLTRVLRTQPDAYEGISGGRGPMMLQMSKVFKEQAFNGPVYGVSADITAMEQGAADMEGWTASVLADWKASVVTNKEKEIYQKYLAKYKADEMEPPAIASYNTVYLLAQALSKAGTVDDAEKVAKTLREGQWDTIWSEKWGKAKYIGQRLFGLPITVEQPIYFSGVRGGKLVSFDAIKAAD